jgi:acyl carrier protein
MAFFKWRIIMTENTLETLCREIATMLNIEKADPDTPLGQLGIDSLNVVELIMITQQIYTEMTNYEEYAFDEHSTLRDIDAHMLRCSAN